MPGLPDLVSLECFVVAAERPSFRSAAEAVALSPAAFSDRIRRLEDELGAALFHRTTRRVTLTEAGRRLLPQAQRALAEARRCARVVADAAHPAPFALKLGTRFELGLSWLVPALDPLRVERPERTLHLSFGESDDLMQRMQAGRLDAVVSSARLVSGGLDYVALHPERYVFVAAPERLACSPMQGPEDAARHPLIDASPGLPLFRYLLDALDHSEPWPFTRVELLGTIAAIRHRVLEGAGVAVLPAYFVAPQLEAGQLVQLLPKVSLRQDTFRLIWRTGHPLDDELRRLAASLQARPLQ